MNQTTKNIGKQENIQQNTEKQKQIDVQRAKTE